MKQNIGHCDRIIRIVAGVILLSLIFILDGDIRWVGLIGVIPLLTAGLGFCPLYCCCKMNTAKCCSSENDAADKKADKCCGGGTCHDKDDTPAA
ncbi:MAG: DUF2892 domain-containing protein [Pseudomonadota bacterium]